MFTNIPAQGDPHFRVLAVQNSPFSYIVRDGRAVYAIKSRVSVSGVCIRGVKEYASHALPMRDGRPADSRPVPRRDPYAPHPVT